MMLRRPRFKHTTMIVLGLFVASQFASAASSSIEIATYHAKHSGIGEASTFIVGESEVVLIDAQWLLPDGAALAEQIAATGKPLTHVLITHGHPDRYMGLGPIMARFPDAKVLARAPVKSEIELEFPSKWIHWSAVFGDGIPTRPVVPGVFDGDSLSFDGFTVRWIDMPPAETRAATVFYVPELQLLVTGDVVFSKMHSYFADLNNPRGWIDALESLKAVGPVKTLVPGHGPVGGSDLIDEAIGYMRTYMDVAQPGVPLAEIVEAMVARYPDYAGEEILWWTRGPGFGAFGPRSLGVPRRALDRLPPALAYPDQGSGCSAPRLALIHRLFHDGFTGGHMDVLDEVLAEDFVFEDPNFPPGREGLKALVRKNNTAFDDWRFELHDVLCDGNKITVRWTGRGTHVASFMGEQPTDRDVALNGISVYAVENGRIAADWVMPDNLGFLTQIGIVDPVNLGQ